MKKKNPTLITFEALENRGQVPNPPCPSPNSPSCFAYITNEITISRVYVKRVMSTRFRILREEVENNKKAKPQCDDIMTI